MTDDELKALFQATHRLIEEANAENLRRFDLVDASQADTRRHFDITAEGMRYQIGLIAENVTGVNERLTGEIADVRIAVRTGFEDLQAMMKFSHGELDRRIVPLEESRQTVDDEVADLHVRVERLEKPTH